MPLLDVRSPSEFAHGHAPGRYPCPFSATTSGPKWAFATRKRAKRSYSPGPLPGRTQNGRPRGAGRLSRGGRPLEVYCWRGGMRSQSVAWLLQTAGHAVKRWEGGYKAYRGRVLDSWCGDHTWVVLSGLTGSGKTEILRHMASQAQVLDSGRLGPPQRDPLLATLGRTISPPTSNLKTTAPSASQGLDPHQSAWWIEDESRSIGRIWLQHGFFDRKKEAPLIIAQRSRENRLDHLVALYGQASREDLAAVFPKIAKRLGHQNAQWAMDAVYAGDLRSAADLALQYYDRTYSESMAKRQDYILAQVDVTDCTFAEPRRRSFARPKRPYKHGYSDAPSPNYFQPRFGLRMQDCPQRLAGGHRGVWVQSGSILAHLLFGHEANEDAAVMDLGNGDVLVHTTDFFTPIVDDAFEFGQIAAANAISDVYAMGATPDMALAILCWPLDKLPAAMAGQVLAGARDTCTKAGIPLAGGHSIDVPQPIFGLSGYRPMPSRCLKDQWRRSARRPPLPHQALGHWHCGHGHEKRIGHQGRSHVGITNHVHPERGRRQTLQMGSTR